MVSDSELKQKKLSSGITDLDLILEDGYPNPGNVIVIGPSGMEKNALAYHFISAGNENAYIVCSSSTPGDIINRASNFGINLNKPNIYFIDAYSSSLGKSVDSTDKIKIVTGASALNDLSIALNEAMKANEGKKIRIIFDTLSTFVLYNPKESIKKFLSVVGGRLRSANATTIYLIDEGVHDRQLVSLLEQGMDGKYVISEAAGKLVLQIPEIDLPITIKLGPGGIAIV
ncbi:hypothetical protein HY988_06700 [Candidatus Micrarchaeota archaeon]|nr:hypothetical protein [Candidatus Micrarchaeota archaeon]